MALSLRFLAACAAAVLVTAAVFAAEATSAQPAAATKPAAAPVSAVKTEGPTVALPKFEVSANRLREIDLTIKKLEKLIARETKLLEKSAVDDTLNNEKVSKAAALFGGKSTVQRASVAAVRIESMEKEISLLETLRTPLTNEDRALMEKLVTDQRTYRRELDITLR
ncbi:MAG: hypothetical protein HYV95_03165 [Opitutae bacterium]|nr:hypothetical protein [Opitutae bacterium]